ncbi:MAG TPA: carbamoyltransferase HypF [Streptosporangiaceae bacterium]|nr:carbamoyltransferase HypF [Streptosporangiaceae bacterium]
MTGRVRASVRVQGVVQGVGFRPFVYSLATRLGLAGWVGNDADGVFAEVEGPAAGVQDFLASLARDAPPLAQVHRVTAQSIAPDGRAGFAIVSSDAAGRRRALVSADTATCLDCLRELADPADRRFGYPFINCTNCGPRFTIVRDVPYDRPLTTMAGFAMCAACRAEYDDPANRRFHAQPVCCPACGPRLRLAGATGHGLGPAWPAGERRSHPPGTGVSQDDDPLAGAVRVLSRGQVLAVKGLGGYHLAVDAHSQRAAARLRAAKHREDKPFAVMVPDLAAARDLCAVDELAERLLASPRRPIVLLPRRPGGLVADAVAPGSQQLGLILPYTPLHHLLLRALSRPIVLTSGNVSDEPIAYRDDDALARLGGIADSFLTHDRPIHIRTDDSVVRPFRGQAAVLRRARGYAPEPLAIRGRFPRPVLACGAELKNTFCLGREQHAFLSHHIGDLENYETLRSFTEGIEHFQRLFDVTPELIAHDLHPEYLSTKYALGYPDAELIGVQHHHAHIASCLADNDEDGPVIGVAFDGTGFGPDGTIWGGEFLIAELASATRGGCLAGLPMPGGAAAIRQPWRMAAVYLDAAFPGALPGGLAVAARNAAAWADVLAMARRGVNSPLTSSAGRLFDAVAALLGVRDTINYEGQAAVELEQLAAGSPASAGYPARITPGPPFTVTAADLVHAAAGDLLDGVPAAVVSARFHRGVADFIVAGCQLLRSSSGLGTVALSGGVFQNLLLLGTVTGLLEADGFRVLTHSRVPPNDGGISLGQALVAAARPQ